MSGPDRPTDAPTPLQVADALRKTGCPNAADSFLTFSVVAFDTIVSEVRAAAQAGTPTEDAISAATYFKLMDMITAVLPDTIVCSTLGHRIRCALDEITRLRALAGTAPAEPGHLLEPWTEQRALAWLENNVETEALGDVLDQLEVIAPSLALLLNAASVSHEAGPDELSLAHPAYLAARAAAQARGWVMEPSVTLAMLRAALAVGAPAAPAPEDGEGRIWQAQQKELQDREFKRVNDPRGAAPGRAPAPEPTNDETARLAVEEAIETAGGNGQRLRHITDAEREALDTYYCAAYETGWVNALAHGVSGGPAGSPAEPPPLIEAGRNLDADALPDDLAALRGAYYLHSDKEADVFDAALAEIVRLRAAPPPGAE